MTGSEIDRDTRISARSPSGTDTKVSTMTGMTSDADVGMSQPFAWHTISTAIAMLGSALLTSHIITSRATTPGAVSRLMKSMLAAATMGRTMRWVKSRLVLTLEVPPNSTATTSSAAGLTPAWRWRRSARLR